MPTRDDAPPEAPSERDHDNLVRLHGVTWAQYEMILAIRGEHTAPRIAYHDGELELLSPGVAHAAIKKHITRLVEAWAEEVQVNIKGFGSWTIKDPQARRAIEPDDCYVVGLREPKVPDLAIEVEWAAGALDRLAIYGPLGVREVWTWKGRFLTVHALHKNAYVRVGQSMMLPTLDLGLLQRFIGDPNPTMALRSFRTLLRKRAG